MARLLTMLAVLTVLPLAVGCGESDQEQAREVVQAYVDAQNDEDFEAVCDVYSESLKQELAVGENCAAFVQEQTTGADVTQELEVVEVRVRDDTGTADIDAIREGGEGPSRLTLTLTKESDDEWRITALQ